jgi:hypothetical protein
VDRSFNNSDDDGDDGQDRDINQIDNILSAVNPAGDLFTGSYSLPKTSVFDFAGHGDGGTIGNNCGRRQRTM